MFATSRSREQAPATSKSIGNHYTEARTSPRHVLKRPVKESKDMQYNETTDVCQCGKPGEIAIKNDGFDSVFIEHGMSSKEMPRIIESETCTISCRDCCCSNLEHMSAKTCKNACVSTKRAGNCKTGWKRARVNKTDWPLLAT